MRILRSNSSLAISLILLLSMLAVSGSIVEGTPVDINSLSQNNEPSIILMIGDGMGFEHIKLGRWVEVGSNDNLTMEQLPWNASVTTNSADSAVTDSAAAATAMATGYKTNNSMLSISPDLVELQTILEIAQSLEKSTGLVSTTHIQHATPAAFMAHVINRNNYTEITRQIVEETGVDVLLGGGRQYFSESQLNIMESNGYTITENRTELAAVTSGKILGLFGSVEIDYEVDRNFATTPSLGEMTDKAIELLSQDSDGFFLMVEGGKIDWAAHAHDKVGVALELAAFNDAVRIAINYVNTHDNTILIVTADHETGRLTVVSNNLSDDFPVFGLSEEQNRTLRIDRANNISVTWDTTGHSSIRVPIFGLGSSFDTMTDNDTIDNTNIFDIMVEHYGYTLSPTTTPTTPGEFPMEYVLVAVPILVVLVIAVVFLKRR